MNNKIVITFGTFDLMHVGHIKILKRAKELGEILIVGISTDKLNYKKKQKKTIFDQYERKEIIDSLKYVDHSFFEESLAKKRKYILKYKADILVMGDDWKGKFDEFSDICQVIYLPRTENISTSDIIKYIQNNSIL
jgi:glycerol-3-phosphate cytidylyltransferase